MKKLFLVACIFYSGLFADSILMEARNYPQVHVERDLLCDVELLLNEGFAPLDGFLDSEDYHSVLERLRLKDGSVWPIPIVFPMDKEKALELEQVGHFTIIDDQSYPVAIFDISEVYLPNLEKECVSVYGTTDDNHPMIQKILARKDQYYIGGKLRKIALPQHFDFSKERRTPRECKDYFCKNGWTKIIGFQTRNPLHRAHMALIALCMGKVGEDAKLLLHPVVGTTQPGDINHYTRVKCYQKLLKYYSADEMMISLLPLSMRMAGPREALWHALIRKNYGCTHFIVGRDHAGPSFKKKDGNSFFGPYDAHKLLDQFKDEIGIEIIASEMIVYDQNQEKYVPSSEVGDSDNACYISGTQFRQMLLNDQEIPSWFSYPEVVDLLRNEYTNSKGTCIYFVGLSGAGKSTLSLALKQQLQAVQDKAVTILDGDIIRKYLSNKLGFSKEDRSINVRRIGFISSLIAEAGGICICANIAPYENDRLANREIISNAGQYIEVFVDTPLEVCEARDAKGLYAAARAGTIKQFTGISDPFEIPTRAEITINSSENLDETMELLIEKLQAIAPHLFL